MKNFTRILTFIPFLFVVISCTEPNDDDFSPTISKGCMNPSAVNYDNKAIMDDGSCVIVGNKQNNITAKFTATWCGPCGSSGVPNFQNYTDDVSDKSITFSLQLSDNISSTFTTITPLMNGFKNHFQIQSLSTPSYGLNDDFIPNQNLNLARTNVNNNYNTPPRVGLGMKWTHGAGPNQGKININVYVKFYETLNDDFKLSLFFIAKDIKAQQKVGDSLIYNFNHKNILISEGLNNNIYGKEIIKGGCEKNEVVHYSTVIPIPYSFKMSNIRLNAVLWRVNNNNQHFFENCTIY
jgi:hypothetical protein